MLVDHAAAWCDRQADDFDEIWCVVDVDQFDLAAATSLARDRGIRLAVSNPCFEVLAAVALRRLHGGGSGRCRRYPAAEATRARLHHAPAQV
ncbi:MAG: RloB family protein [Labedaea sp.]